MKFIKCLILIIFTSSSYAFVDGVKQRFSPEIGVEFPTSFGIHGRFNFNPNMYVRLGLGFSSELLLRNTYRTNLTKIDRSQLDLITDSLANSLYSDIRIGYRGSRQKGFYGELGYSVMSLGKGETSSSRLQTIGRQDLGTDSMYEIQSLVHNATLHGGYSFPILRNVGLSIELGLIKPFFTDVNVDYQQEDATSMEEEDSQAIEGIFKEIFVLTGSFWLSYIF